MAQSQHLKELEKKLGHTFKDRGLIEQALTHASVRAGRPTHGDNERLEFLGDRVLGLALADFLHARHPKLREGELARRFNRLVSGEACAEVARSLDLGRFLILADSEAGSGGRDKDTILAGALEALLGAMFLDGDFERARKVVVELWATRIASISENPVDPKSALQEWAQAKSLPLPRYAERSRSGPDHAPSFVAEVSVSGHKSATASGASKRQAEQAAALEFLVREGVWKMDGNE